MWVCHLTLRQAREYERTGNLPDCKNCNPYSTQTVSSGDSATSLLNLYTRPLYFLLDTPNL